MIENAAVFLSGRRIYKGVNVVEQDSDIIVRHRINDQEVSRYSVVEVAKDGMAWDVTVDGQLQRLVVQQGCGCSGMKPYKNDPQYSGPFTRR